MKIFIDESGSFAETPAGLSLFCAVHAADRSYSQIRSAFMEWKQEALGKSHANEVKGSRLTPDQLESFVRTVVLPDTDFWLTAVGVHSGRTKDSHLIEYRDGAVESLRAIEKEVMERAKHTMARQYGDMAGWMRHRSPQNCAWLGALVKTIFQAITHTIVRFIEPEDDAEFVDWRIIIDESFIRRPEHVMFWQEWLRNGLFAESKRSPLPLPKPWLNRDHPFVRKYVRQNAEFDLTDLFRGGLSFGDSRQHLGLQVADVCASICRRGFSKDHGIAAYRMLLPRIVRAGGSGLTLLDFVSSGG